jgi:hypothetical protein
MHGKTTIKIILIDFCMFYSDPQKNVRIVGKIRSREFLSTSFQIQCLPLALLYDSELSQIFWTFKPQKNNNLQQLVFKQPVSEWLWCRTHEQGTWNIVQNVGGGNVSDSVKLEDRE